MSVEDAKRRVANETDLLANNDPLARDIIAVMRELGRLTDENRRLREALTQLIYETTHLSPQEEDGSHRCRISARALSLARAAIAPEPTEENRRLREALQAMVDHEVEYMTINNLGDPEKQHNVIRARAAIAASGEAIWPDGCLHPNSCARNSRCGYVGCVHQGKTIALAAEPASGEAYVLRDMSESDEADENWLASHALDGDDVKALRRTAAPPPLPTQGEKETELREAYGYAVRFLHAFIENNAMQQVEPLPTLCGVLTQIDNATTITRDLRQRADEATRACAKIAGDFSAANYAAKPFTSYAEGRADAGAAIEAAICARITPTPPPTTLPPDHGAVRYEDGREMPVKAGDTITMEGVFPPQGEEETAAEAVIMRIESNAPRGLNIAETRALIAGYRALRQRAADEAAR